MADQTSGDGPSRHVPLHLDRELSRLNQRIKEGDPLWPAQLAVGLAIALHLTLTDKLVIGPRWLIPSVEGLLLAALIIMAPARASGIRRDSGFIGKHGRTLLFVILGLVTLTYLVSLGLLVHYLITGGKTGGHALIGSGVVLWVTNVLIFAVIYFELDRGGPLARYAKERPWPDFYFPEMDASEYTPLGKKWQPTFLDYLYVSVTNSTAFSPTDTLPLTQAAKVLMGVQGTAAIVTIGLVVARAVNILS